LKIISSRPDFPRNALHLRMNNYSTMSIAIFSLSSSLHKETCADISQEQFIQDIENALGQKFIFCGDDFSSFGSHEADLIYIRTGGTEGLFKQLGLTGKIKLLTSGESNSLAASMEILSYLKMLGRTGEILHGTPEYVASRIKTNTVPSEMSSFVKPLPSIDLNSIRLGVIGKPSDWLISSDVDYGKAASRLNVELVDIPMEALLKEIGRYDVDMKSFLGSEVIYDSLLKLIETYSLGGLTLRCFDLLDKVHNTGCLALARLNAQGLVATCEGDIPAMLSMTYLQKTRGCPGFQCNLSRVNGDELLFAHCTAPLNMLDRFSYATHFESGIGTAIKGEVKTGEIDIFKIAPNLEEFISIPGTIVRNESFPNLCRTQIVVNAPGAADYFLHSPLANHHIISLNKTFVL